MPFFYEANFLCHSLGLVHYWYWRTVNSEQWTKPFFPLLLLQHISLKNIIHPIWNDFWAESSFKFFLYFFYFPYVRIPNGNGHCPFDDIKSKSYRNALASSFIVIRLSTPVTLNGCDFYSKSNSECCPDQTEY